MTASHISPVTSNSDFVCECDGWFRSACKGELRYGVHDDRSYCVLHFPSERKGASFKETFERKIRNKDFDFKGVWFPIDINFFQFVFTEVADFSHATFSADPNFMSAVFQNEANFSKASFNGNANFLGAEFQAAAFFLGTTFAGPVNFNYARFSSEIRFDYAHFSGELSFAGEERNVTFPETAWVTFQFAKIIQPEDVTFHTLTLRPCWLVHVDARRFEFTNVDWDWRSTDEEVASLQARGISQPHRMLAIACRNLAVNAEENHRYENASKFRYMSMDAARLEHWNGFDLRKLSWWYWAASGYGERIWRAGVVLLGILLVCAALYTKVGFARWEPRLASESDAAVAQRDETGAPLKLTRALTYSAAVMTFQRPEPRPATTVAQTIVLLETILGPVQAALLALAIRRKFMR